MFELYLITDEYAFKEHDMIDIVHKAVLGGVSIVQLREKQLNTKQFIEKAIALKKLLDPLKIPLIINDRIDIAIALNASGVHIGQSDMPYEYVKKIIPKSMILGLSVETIEQVKIAESYDVDYLGVSPIFKTPTKTNFECSPWDLDGLKKVKEISHHKLIAIGGINSTNAESVLKAGADGIAVVSAICSASNPTLAAIELKTIIIKTSILKKKSN